MTAGRPVPAGSLDGDVAGCRACASLLARRPVDPLRGGACVEPRPLATPVRRRPVLVLGPAPGLEQYRSGRAAAPPVAPSIRAVIEEAGVPRHRFDDVVHAAVSVKCFPGSRVVTRGGVPRREDRLPGVEMVLNCLPFLAREVAEVDPQLVVTFGGLSLRHYLRLTDRADVTPALGEFVGRSETWDGRTVVFFPYLGRSSRWLNLAGGAASFTAATALLRDAVAAVTAPRPTGP